MSTAKVRLSAIAISVVLIVVIVLIAAKPATAGTYTVTQCSSHNPSAGQATWERTSTHYEARNRCAVGDGLQVFHDAAETDLNRFGAWVWRAPPGTVFTQVQTNASLTNQAGHHGELQVVAPGGRMTEFGEEHNDSRVHAIEGEFAQFHAWLRCAAPGPGGRCGRAGDDSAHAYVRGVFLRTADRAAPTLSLTGGSLLAGEVVRGVRGLGFSATDLGGGIREVYVTANGAEIATDIRNCKVSDGFATALEPCPASAIEAFALDTAGPTFTTGPNQVSACVEDLAADGAPNRACAEREVWVDNACPGSAVEGASRLRAGFGGGRAVGLARSDRHGIVRGLVRSPSGPLAGATVCALTQEHTTGARIVVGATATTNTDGSFAIELPPGPSRNVFVHQVSGETVLARHGLTLASVARPTLRVNPRRRARAGRRLHFEGELPPRACDDRVVKVQARIGKRRWQVFRTDRADQDCRFSARYKLRATENARVYRFRALVPQQEGYPYSRGYSATAKVEVERR